MTITESVQAADTEVAALITYSSILEVDGSLRPSRMSMLAALAAREYFGDNPVDLVIAAEQSYKDYPETTGNLLEQEYRRLLPQNAEVEVIKPGEHRLINTTYQVEALAAYADINKIGKLCVIGWDFHAARINRLFSQYASDLEINYASVDSILKEMEEKAPDRLRQELALMGFEGHVSLARILNVGVADFADRERLTRLGSWPAKGKLVNGISRIAGNGRLDDLNPWALPVKKRDDKPWYKPWQRSSYVSRDSR